MTLMVGLGIVAIRGNAIANCYNWKKAESEVRGIDNGTRLPSLHRLSFRIPFYFFALVFGDDGIVDEIRIAFDDARENSLVRKVLDAGFRVGRFEMQCDGGAARRLRLI